MIQKIILNTSTQGDIHLEMQNHTLSLRTSQYKKELCGNCSPSFDAAVSANDTLYIVYSNSATTYLARFFNNTFDIVPLPSIRNAQHFYLLLHGNIPILFYTISQNTRTLLYFSFLTSDGKPFFIDTCSNLSSPFTICTDTENKDLLITYVSPYGDLLTRRLIWSNKTLSDTLTLDQRPIGTKYPSCLYDHGLHVTYLVKDKTSNAIAYCPPGGKPFLIYQFCQNQVHPVIWKEGPHLFVSFLQDHTVFHITLENLSMEKQAVPAQTQLVWMKSPALRLDGCSLSQLTFLYEQQPASSVSASNTGSISAVKQKSASSASSSRPNAPLNLNDDILQFAGRSINIPENLELEKLKIRIKFLEDKLQEMEKRFQA